MEPEAEDPLNNDNSVTWSGSDGSQELCVPKSSAESYNEDEISNNYSLDPNPPHIPKSDPKSPECLQLEDWESACDQQSLPEQNGSEEDCSFQEEDEIYLSKSRESITESPQIQTSPVSLSPEPEHSDMKSPTGQKFQKQSLSSSSSLGCVADMTLALTLTTEDLLGASNRHDLGSGNRRVDSSEEGGRSEAPPASVFFEIPDEGAEQAEKWNSESDIDLSRPDRHRARHTPLGRNKTQSERYVKETKSKCKQIARLLTDAPNPQNKGALLFKKRRQRVKKFTLVSYGTGEQLDRQDQIEDTDEVRSVGYNFVTTSDSELGEEYSVYHQQHNFSLNWAKMEELPAAKGKGVLMFAQRRKRMDDIVSEQEELRSKGLPAEELKKPACTKAINIYDTKEMYMHDNQANYVDENHKQHIEYQENTQMNHLANVPKPLVPNRTARPFLGFQDGTTAHMMPDGVAPMTKRSEPRFKVPVPINTNPQVWSPTGDIIASRDERISVPAIKTGILPESKRKPPAKQQMQQSEPHLQNRGDRRSYMESEEDCFSLGAEACNFMQPRAMKLKTPPPVAPKPNINLSCPPWMGTSSSSEPYFPPRSPVSQPSHGSAGPHKQHYLQQQQDWAHPQQTANRWALDQTKPPLQTPVNAWAPVSSSSQLHPQQTTNNWTQQQPQSPVSMQARSPTYSSHCPPFPSRNKLGSVPNSVASCPPQGGKSYIHALQASQKGQVSDRGINQAGDGPILMGKGAQLFAKRQCRMEKFVVDSDSVQASKTRSASPTLSLPNSWRYSSNVRAPPPLSYNPLLAPFYPPSAGKQFPSTSPQIKPKTKEKPKAPQKHLNALDIMKHQPYQLDSSLFKYDAVPEAKSPSTKPTQVSKFEVTQNLKHRVASSHSPYNTSELVIQDKAEAPAAHLGFGRSRSMSLPKWLNSKPSPGLLSPVSTPGMQAAILPTERQTSFQENVYRPLSPWEAASRSPIGSVEEAFVFQSLPSSVASSVKAAGHCRSLPEPPDEWKRRVCLDPPAISRSSYLAAPFSHTASLSRTFSPKKPAFYGPPFRPAQPLGLGSKSSFGYIGSSPRKCSSLYSAVQRS
ncbi:synaptopodin-2 [Echeneis naucrates]|uniref:synaptopodin-2 n=1 Tax=Echeneis naucrates TaxID=173247 RepID=UPI0011135B4D|nr:synaptopodin-2-like [Echeneis naucrates]